MSPHLLTGLGDTGVGSKDNLQGSHSTPDIGQTSSNEEDEGTTITTGTNEDSFIRDQPTGRDGDPPGLSNSSGSSQTHQVSTSGEIVEHEHNHCISLSLTCEEEDEGVTSLVDHLHHQTAMSGQETLNIYPFIYWQDRH